MEIRARCACVSGVQARLIIMAKFPRSGAVKTRLIPALGADGACELHRVLVRRTLAAALAAARAAGFAIEAAVADAPDAAAARAWLGEGFALRDQAGGDLGARMERAMAAAFAAGDRAVVVIGTDCPGLGAGHLTEAFAALGAHDLVVGPALDGGYYLIGTRQPRPELFLGVAWGTADVLARTLATAQAAGLSVHSLPPLSDVDVPEDLPAWAVLRDCGE